MFKSVAILMICCLVLVGVGMTVGVAEAAPTIQNNSATIVELADDSADGDDGAITDDESTGDEEMTDDSTTADEGTIDDGDAADDGSADSEEAGE